MSRAVTDSKWFVHQGTFLPSLLHAYVLNGLSLARDGGAVQNETLSTTIGHYWALFSRLVIAYGGTFILISKWRYINL